MVWHTSRTWGLLLTMQPADRGPAFRLRDVFGRDIKWPPLTNLELFECRPESQSEEQRTAYIGTYHLHNTPIADVTIAECRQLIRLVCIRGS